MIGVQNVEADVETSVRYAKSAATRGADAIISLPPRGKSDVQIIDHYNAVGAATSLPLIAQAVGSISMELLVTLFREVPTLKALKDEAGNPLLRAKQLISETGGKLADFSGGGGRTMLTEMHLGFSGCCPYVGLADLYQRSFNLWHGGREREAFDMLGRISAFNEIPGSNEYILVVRGTFPDTAVMRRAAGHPRTLLDSDQKEFIRDAWIRFLRPYLRA